MPFNVEWKPQNCTKTIYGSLLGLMMNRPRLHRDHVHVRISQGAVEVNVKFPATTTSLTPMFNNDPPGAIIYVEVVRIDMVQVGDVTHGQLTVVNQGRTVMYNTSIQMLIMSQMALNKGNEMLLMPIRISKEGESGCQDYVVGDMPCWKFPKHCIETMQSILNIAIIFKKQLNEGPSKEETNVSWWVAHEHALQANTGNVTRTYIQSQFC